MRTVIQYLAKFLSEGTATVLLFLPICIFLRLLYLKERKKTDLSDKPDMVHETILLLFMTFLIMLFTQTFIYNPGLNKIYLIPFYIIIKQLIESGQNVFLYRGFIFNVIGNIGIFVPIGIFIAYLFKTNYSQTLVRGFFISLIIETVQIPLERTTDVDDLILNTTGAAVGYGLYRLYHRIKRKYREKKHRSVP